MCVLLIESSSSMRESLAHRLRLGGFATEVVSDAVGALACAEGHRVIVLDVELPGGPWVELVREMRARTGARIVLLTPGASVEDRVAGLNAGADDCLPKPFSVEELLARVRALLRGPRAVAGRRIVVDELVVDTEARRVTHGGVAVQLTAREFALLEFLARRAGETVSTAELEDHLYGPECDLLSNSLASAVCLLRTRLAEAGSDRQLVRTERGVGYRLAAS